MSKIDSGQLSWLRSSDASLSSAPLMLYEKSVRKRSRGERLFISLIPSKRHQRHISGEFDGVGDKPLVGITKLISSGRPYLKLR